MTALKFNRDIIPIKTTAIREYNFIVEMGTTLL